MKSLIGTALTNNRDLRMATLKVQEARAQYRVTDADRYPQLNGDGSTTYGGKLKGDTTTSSDYAAGLNLNYDLDFFGRLKTSARPTGRTSSPAKRHGAQCISC